MKKTIISAVEAGAREWARHMPRYRASAKEAQEIAAQETTRLAQREAQLREYVEFLDEHAPLRERSWADELGADG